MTTIHVNPARHGSIFNAIYDQARSKAPKVGMGVTEVMYSDRHPYTVVAILSPRRIKVQPDKATRIDHNGYSESQEYKYEPQPDSPSVILRLNKHGKWKREGDPQGATYLIGVREEYYDFSR